LLGSVKLMCENDDAKEGVRTPGKETKSTPTGARTQDLGFIRPTL
jgi:hypothetical protein